jgi:hypothetical protein
VKENGEFENMSEDLELFDGPPCFKDLVGRVTSKFVCRGDEVQLRGHFDCGKARPHYVVMKLNSESHLNQYKEVVERWYVGRLSLAYCVCLVHMKITHPLWSRT